MKPIRIRVVDSIDEEMDRILNLIRMRAYENFLRRDNSFGGELDDWLSAERELICLLPATIDEDGDRFVAEIEIPTMLPGHVEIDVTGQDLLIHAWITDHSEGDPTSTITFKPAFGVIRFPADINPTGVRAEYRRGILWLIAPLASEGGILKKSA
jgi:HSP20 family molecular chaperone IbpA